MEEISGQVTDIIFHNETNGYTICDFETKDLGSITIVGYLPFINAGESLKIYGKMVIHKEYGEQFKIETFEKIMPEGIDGLKLYLGSGLIKGVGQAMANRIVEKFGEETIIILKTEPEKLAEVKGISVNKAIEIGQEFNEKWDLWQIVSFLERFGIGANNANRVYKELGIDAIAKIEDNPYILIDIVYGIDFKQIDKMAMSIGISTSFNKRLESGIKYGLLLSSYNGHTCVIKENLVQFAVELMQVDEEHVETALINCKANGEIVIETIDEVNWVFLYAFYKAEKNISDKITTLLKNTKKIPNFETALKNVEKHNTIQLSEMQLEAVKTVNESNVTIITGGPGTGKTTIIKTIIELFENNKKKVILCAPTGRAAKRMAETTGKEAKTIHRLLEIGKFDEDRLASIDKYISPINGDVVIIDEMSMVDVFLMNYILKGIYNTTKLILVGDVDQLPSVGPGCVLKDLIQSEVIPTVHLNVIFRQAAESKIITNAHNINNGYGIQRSEVGGQNNDFFHINELNPAKILETVISLSTGRLKKYGDFDFLNNIQVITPSKKGNLGTKELNNQLQKYINASNSSKKERHYGETIFRENDRVMQIKNNYDISWTRKDEHGEGIFNGEFGLIECIDEKEKMIKILFDDEKEAWYNFNELEQLELAYAITVHKSQGSEFDVVILVIPSQIIPMLLTRNLLYTAITRAKKLLIIVGGNNIINYMISNVHTKTRNTGLKNRFVY